MGKGFLYTGAVFFLAVTLIIAANYVFLSKNTAQASSAKILAIDRVQSRYIDISRIIAAAIAESGTCAAATPNINAAFANLLMNSTGANVTLNSIDCLGTPQIRFTVDSFDGLVHKQNF